MAIASVVGLDHIVVVVRDLDAAAQRWRKLGFTLSPRGLHSAHMGTANHTLMLGDDYLELMGVVAAIWFGNPGLGIACGLAVIANLICAGLAGSLVPLALQRLKLDPAVASSVLVTWLTDTIGFLAFLGIATMILLR